MAAKRVPHNTVTTVATLTFEIRCEREWFEDGQTAARGGFEADGKIDLLSLRPGELEARIFDMIAPYRHLVTPQIPRP